MIKCPEASLSSRVVKGWELGPFEGPPTLKPPALPGDIYSKSRRVAVKRLALGRSLEEVKLVRTKDALVDLSRLLPRTNDLNHVAKRRDHEHLNGLGENRTANDNARLKFARVQPRPQPPVFAQSTI